MSTCLLAHDTTLTTVIVDGLELKPSSNIASSTLHTVAAFISSLNTSILFNRRALQLKSSPHPHRLDSLIRLADALEARFDQTYSKADLDEAIALYREAHNLQHLSISSQRFLCAPSTFTDKLSAIMNNPASLLEKRFRQALDLHPAPHPDRSTSLNNLASALRIQFGQTGQLGDLEEAISFHRQALDLRSAQHPDRSMSLNNLATALQTWFEQTGRLDDLEEAISFSSAGTRSMFRTASPID
ncbi:hypothetical protein EW146_g7015 [Bondarzewia mesenterica]|uniref:Uncharacterized protein n=1 Tax=Bondarzewia mesenterica TaxID=1095465 RepID=A0A4S4LSN8_9AGAM|nr:hypothetical protein EW146_g7015 [Bondarzewia mesenterica]